MHKKLSLAVALIFAFALAPSARAQSTPTTVPAEKPAPSAPSASPAMAATATAAVAHASDGHEYAPILEKTINYKDWTFKSLKDGTPVNLREWMRGKKLVMVVYYAPWCGNWKMEAPVVARLYDKYKAHGFDVIAVNEYGSQDAARAFFGEGGATAPYTVVVESEGREARDTTTHAGYRQASGDSRRWGSPFNVFLEPATLNKSGDVLAEKVLLVGGELIEKDVEQFIRQRLGLDTQAGVEPCEGEDKSPIVLKKP